MIEIKGRRVKEKLNVVVTLKSSLSGHRKCDDLG